MRIGIDCRMYGSKFTGIGRYTQELVEHLITLNKKLSNPHELVLFFNALEYKNFKPDSHCEKILASSPHYSLKEQTVFLKKIRSEKLDLMHFTHFNIPLLYNKPFIVTIHDLTLSLFPGKKMTKWYHRLAYHLTINHAVKKAEKIIAVSEHTKKDLTDHFKLDAQKIKVVYNGVGNNFEHLETPIKLEKTTNKYGINKPFILYTGVWRDHKNLPRLIKAFHILRSEKGLDLQLVITGKEDKSYPEVRQGIKDYSLEKEVVLPGLVPEEDLVNLYNKAVIFAFPSLYEGFGIPPLEAMRCGTPVAASNRSSVPEICSDAAVYFDPYNVEDIADKLEMIYKNTDLQVELIEKGIKHIGTFSWEKMAQDTFEILKTC
jgi:glycosyltransferase involved in cell wall biosynthesis